MSTLSDQHVAIASVKGYAPEFSAKQKSPFAWQNTPIFTPGQNSDSSKTIQVQPKGNFEFTIKDSTLQVGNTGVTVEVSDLSINESEQTTFIGGRKYITPSYTKKGTATVTGTSDNDAISVSQDSNGNTILKVEVGGHSSSINLGRIASLTLDTGGGDDKIKVNVKNYYGGVNVSGGDGDDEINVRADYTLARRVTIKGGAGDDTLEISGKALSVLLEGGTGNDKLDAQKLMGEKDTTRDLEGGEGSDIIYGSAGKDTLSGEAGNDSLFGLNGADVIRGGTGNDGINGGKGNDVIHGGTGNDILRGGKGSDLIYGEAGSDILMGESGGDVLSGGEGADYLYGGGNSNDPMIYSSTGTIQTEDTQDILRGDEGVDTFAPSSTSPNNIVPYTGSGYLLVDYDPQVDILV